MNGFSITKGTDFDFVLHIYANGPHGLSLADETVYPSLEFLQATSNDVPSWFETALNWLKEKELYIPLVEKVLR